MYSANALTPDDSVVDNTSFRGLGLEGTKPTMRTQYADLLSLSSRAL